MNLADDRSLVESSTTPPPPPPHTHTHTRSCPLQGHYRLHVPTVKVYKGFKLVLRINTVVLFALINIEQTMQLHHAHIKCLPSLYTARMRFKLAVPFKLDKRLLSARPVMHWSWRSWSIIVHIDLVKSRTPEHVNGVDTVPDYWARANTKLTSLRLCGILADSGPVCQTCFWLIWIKQKWATCSNLDDSRQLYRATLCLI